MRRQYVPKKIVGFLFATYVGLGIWWYQLTWQGNGPQFDEFFGQPGFVIFNLALFNIVVGAFAWLSFQTIYYVVTYKKSRLWGHNLVYPILTLNYLVGYYPPLFAVGPITQTDIYAFTTALVYWVYPLYLGGELYRTRKSKI